MVRRPPRFTGFAAALLAQAACIFAAFVVLWLGQASRHVSTDGARALVIRAVLRADADNVTAEKVAQRIRQQTPDIDVEVITETMGRSLMALQEPWIAEMPDFEVTPLPVLLEFHHPALLTNPASVSEFVSQLEKEPEVEFVAYNETAHNRLVKLANATASIQQHTMQWLLVALGIAVFSIVLSWAAYQGPAMFSSVILFSVMGWLVAFFIAWISFKFWESGAMKTGEWDRLGSAGVVKLVLAFLAINLFASLGGRAIAWRRP